LVFFNIHAARDGVEWGRGPVRKNNGVGLKIYLSKGETIRYEKRGMGKVSKGQRGTHSPRKGLAAKDEWRSLGKRGTKRFKNLRG